MIVAAAQAAEEIWPCLLHHAGNDDSPRRYGGVLGAQALCL